MPARLGQHFLTDTAIARRIVDALENRPDEPVIEIGGGRGALTTLLAQKRSGARERTGTAAGKLENGGGAAARPDGPSSGVWCVELDPELAAELEQRFSPIHVLQADVLTLRLGELVDARWAVVGNIPYAITSPILAWLCDQWRHVDRAVLMMQTEVAERLLAVPGTKAYGRLTVMVRYRAAVERLFDVPAGCFRPRPKVGSTVVRLTMHAAPAVATADERRLFSLVEIGFRWRRKTLRSVLRMGRGLTAEQAGAVLERAGIDPQRRAETLELAEFAALADTLGEPRGR